MNLVIWDIESSNANTDFGSIIEIGGILVDENLKEKDRFNLRCRLPEGEIPQAMALIVNKTGVDMLTKANLSHYQMLAEVEKIFKKWSPAIFLGWSNIGFDDEMIRKEFLKVLDIRISLMHHQIKEQMVLILQEQPMLLIQQY